MIGMKTNITLLYSFRFFRDFLVIAPVIIPFYKSNGLTATQILIVQAVFSAAMLLFEVPSGYISDRWGRKKTLFAGGISIVSGFLIYSISSTVPFFMLAEIFLGFGFSMCSGTESALLFDTLNVLGRKDEYRKIESRAEFSTRIGAAVSSMAGGFLAVFGIRIPFYANVASSSMLPLSALFMKEAFRKKPEHTNALQGILEAFAYSLKDRYIRSAAFVSGAILCTGIISIWGYFLLLETMRFPLAFYGVVFFVYQSASAVGARFSHALSLHSGRRGAMYLFMLIPILYFSIGMFHMDLLVTLAFIQAFLWGFSTPFFLDIINEHAKPELRATVLSIVSMEGRILYVLVGPLFGIVVDAFGVRTGFLFLAAVFLCCIVCAWLLFVRFSSGCEKSNE